MHGLTIAQPDVTLFLDRAGVIREARLSNAVADEGTEDWLGRPWAETVAGTWRDHVERSLENARAQGVAAFQITQRFPSGRELPIEYTTVRLGGRAGLVAVGRSLQAVSELQARLVAAQQAMERDYWKLREIETRYRLLFDASSEAVLLIRAADLRVVEANPAAIRALGLTPSGRDFLAELAPRDRAPFEVMLRRVREQGKAPGMLLHLGRERRSWLVRASLVAGAPEPAFLLQLVPAGGAEPAPPPGVPPPLEELLQRVPDGFAVVDREGVVLRVNRAFLDLVQAAAEPSVVGKKLQRWLARPGADQAVLMAHLARHGTVRLFATVLQGELGSETEVEISGAGDADAGARYAALLVRAVGQRLPADRAAAPEADAARRLGRATLRQIVEETVTAVERRCVEAALELTGGNRTAAAELLGLSRQSLYVKLARYGLDHGHEPDPDRRGG